MSSKFMHSLKLLSCAWILTCYLLTSVSHSADTSEGAQELSHEVNYDLEFSTSEPLLPVIEDKKEQNLEPVEDEGDIPSESTSSDVESKVGLDLEQLVDNIDTVEQDTGRNDPIIEPNLSQENTDSDQNDFLQLPTMDEFITQNTNGAINTDPLPPASFSDSTQTLTTSGTNSFEQNTKTHETPPKQKNYASADCGAKIVAKNPESRNTAGILNENRDDYMLNKCSLESVWVTVELCDYIQVLSIELSVHELFSSLPENFTMSLSLQGGVKPDDWLPPTLFTAKNIRGDQTFRVPTPDQHHARFVRLNLVSHYGSEHYCPITTLRVFGANYVEVLEAIERGSGAQVPAVETSIYLDSTDRDSDELESEQALEGDKTREGFFINALDGLYKYVWPEGEQNPAVNINLTLRSSDNTSEDIIDGVFIEQNNSSPALSATETLEREESVSGLANLSNVTEQSSDTPQHSTETIESRDPVNEIHLNMEATLQEQTYEHKKEDDNDNKNKYNMDDKSNENETLSNTPSEENFNVTEATENLESADTQSYATPQIDLSLTQPAEESSPITADNDTELPDNTTMNITDAIPPVTQVDNSSLSESNISTSSPKDTPVPSTPPTSQNYLVRMQERIARLGENITIIHKYLDQFRHSIQRNVNRTEEVQRSLERKLSQLEDLFNLTLLNSYIQSEEFENAKIYSTDVIASLKSDIEHFKTQFLLCCIATLIIVVVIAAVSVTQYNTQLRREVNSLSQQFNSEMQKLLKVIREDRKKISNGSNESLAQSLTIRNQENDYFEVHQTDHGVLSDSNLHSYVNHTVKKKKKTRKNSNLVLPYP